MAEATCKIGFHLAEGGDPTGIGDWMQRLDAAGIPFFIKAADTMRGLDEAQDIVRRNRALGRDVPHTVVFRRSGKLDDERHFDIPRYELEPEAAARQHWALHRDHFPTNLDPAITWIETINEVRKEVRWCDWLGEFAYHTGQLALAGGYRYAAFGFSSGTPDVTAGAWETPGMRRFLALCADHPDRLAVALHEYSYSIRDIWREAGYLVGGFRWLFRAADRLGLPRPTVLITEWGWENHNVPEPAVALAHVEDVGALYARYPELLGAAIWYLGGGYNGIAQRAQRIIAPLTAFTLSHRYPERLDRLEVVLPDEVPGEGSYPISRAIWREQRRQPSARPVAIGATLARTVVAGEPFSVEWRLHNDGIVSWGPGAHLRQVRGPQVAPAQSILLSDLAPGTTVTVTLALRAPAAPGVYLVRWRAAQATGHQFGEPLDLSLTVTDRPRLKGDSRFLADVTVPDHSTLVAESQFVKIWRVLNNGPRPWQPSDRLTHVGGDAMAPAAAHPVPAAEPGESTELSVSLSAPSQPGAYVTEWQLIDVTGEPFGDRLFALIDVTEALYDVRFVADVTIPDGARLAPGSAFEKRWAVENTGNSTWGPAIAVVFSGGEAMTAAVRQPAPPIQPGATAEVTLALHAPREPGRYRGEWRLVAPDGTPFGDRLWVLIEVKAG
jgi:methionine-rich copper-binding protein CopC